MRRIVRDRSLPDADVEDICQEVFIKLLAIPEDRWSAIQNVDGYLYRTAQSQVSDYAARRRSRPEISLDEELIDTTEYAQQTRKAESGLLLDHLWNSLKPPERELLELMIIGYNEKEMAFRLGNTHLAIRKRMSRLKPKLRRAILNFLNS